jgi:hypothetical protein
METNPVYLQDKAGQRIQVLPRPLQIPGVCVVCQAATDDRQYIDFAFDIDYYGRVYFCTFCVNELLNAVKYIAPEQYEQHLAKVAEQEAELIVLRDQNGKLRDSLASLLGVSDDSSDLLLPADDEVIEQGGTDSQGPTTGGESSESTPSEFVSEQGSVSISDNSSSESTIFDI